MKRVALLSLAALVAASGAFAQQAWSPGTVVLASPAQIPTGWKRCQVMGGPNPAGYYELDCANWFLNSNNTKNISMLRLAAPGKWIKADEAAFEPDVQLDAVRRKAAGAAAPKPATVTRAAAAAAPAGGATPGKYHCVFYIGGVGLQTTPGFTLAGTTYRHDNGGGGTTRFANGVITFVGGPLNGQAGKVEPRIVRLYNEQKSRTVIDCDTK